MQDHHQRAMDRAIERLREESDVRLILLGGSIAKGLERFESDVDLMVVVTEEGFAERQARNGLAFLWKDVADYEGGYVEGRFVSRDFVLAAAERGSEPTRSSFCGVRVVWGDDPEVAAAVPLIPVYPEADRDRRIDAFYAQLVLNRYYFWPEGVRREDPYLKARAATEVVLFGARMVLAHNRVLFPCQKRVMEVVATCPELPEGFFGLSGRTLAGDDVAKEAFCQAVMELVQPRKSDILSRFLQDMELAWYTGSHSVAEW